MLIKTHLFILQDNIIIEICNMRIEYYYTPQQKEFLFKEYLDLYAKGMLDVKIPYEKEKIFVIKEQHNEKFKLIFNLI